MITQNTVVLLERALRPLGVPLKPYEECKRGAAGACMSLLKRLLFHTSSQVASQVAARHAGSLNSLSDRKVVLLAFDILRELSRFSPPLTPEQFMSKSSYGEQKILGVNLRTRISWPKIQLIPKEKIWCLFLSCLWKFNPTTLFHPSSQKEKDLQVD